MILSHGDTSVLKGTGWNSLEIRSDDQIEIVAHRLVEEIPKIFKDHPLEVFIPVMLRDLDSFTLKTSNLVFVRSDSVQDIMRLRNISGVQQITTKGETTKARDIITVPDDYVQELIEECEREFNHKIAVGSFVRILDGSARDFCGHVTSVENNHAEVRVDLLTRLLFVKTLLANLLDLSHVDPARQVFYYCEAVRNLPEESLPLIQQDLKFSGKFPVFDNKGEPEGPGQGGRRKRKGRVTYFVKNLISEGITEPREIALRVLQEWREGRIRKTKNLFIVYCIIKFYLTSHFKFQDWRHLVKRMGPAYRFEPEDFLKLGVPCSVPLVTPPEKVTKDGRTARHKRV